MTRSASVDIAAARPHAGMVAAVVNINDVLDGHVGLDLTCVECLYLNAYVPGLQVGGQVNQFCRHLGRHLGHPIASPAVIEKIGNRFRCEVDAYANARAVPVLHLAKPNHSRWDDRKLDHVRSYLDRAETAGRQGSSRSPPPRNSSGCPAPPKRPSATP